MASVSRKEGPDQIQPLVMYVATECSTMSHRCSGGFVVFCAVWEASIWPEGAADSDADRREAY